MTKQTIFDKHELRIKKGLALGAELIPGAILVYNELATAIKSGSGGTGLSADNWTTWDIKDLAEAVTGGNMPQDAIAALVDVEINDSGGAGADATLSFAEPGIIKDGKTIVCHAGSVNDRKASRMVLAPLSKDGKTAVKSGATGGNTLDYSVKLIGWLVAGTDTEAVELPYVDLKGVLTVDH